MFIFGWRTIFKRLGQTVDKRVCPNCHNETNFVLTKITKWFTFFFIPAIPYDTQYALACSVCDRGPIVSAKDAQSLNAGPILIGDRSVSYQEAIRSAKTPLQNKIIGFALLILSVVLWALGDKPEPDYNGTVVILGWITLGLAVYAFTRKRKLINANAH
jgi:hypothetical protein